MLATHIGARYSQRENQGNMIVTLERVNVCDPVTRPDSQYETGLTGKERWQSLFLQRPVSVVASINGSSERKIRTIKAFIRLKRL